MTSNDPNPNKAAGRWREFVRISGGFWSGSAKGRAWVLTLLVVVFVGAQLILQLGMNLWNRRFFDALEQRRFDDVWTTIMLLPLLVVGIGLCTGGAFLSRMQLQVRWREWLTKYLAGWWIADQRYYRLGISNEDQTAPEYRIAEDVRLSVEPLADFVIGIVTAVATIVAFSGLLWSVGGALDTTIGGMAVHIPGYLAFSALIYSVIASGIAFLTGRSLVGAYGRKNEAEAQFRSEMTRLRENAESVALIRGDDDERRSIMANFGKVTTSWLGLVRQSGVLSGVQSINGALVPVLPLILATPKYMSGELTIGGVVQVAGAFVTVQSSLNWFIDNFVRIAEWMGSANRVGELSDALDDVDASTLAVGSGHIEFGTSKADDIQIENLSVAHRNGRVVIADAQVSIRQGEKVLIGGESGTGKSTLIRALARIWPWGSGRILLPEGAEIAFVPQKPYIPLGNLRGVLSYPHPDNKLDDAEITAAMQRCGLSYLMNKLDMDGTWDQTLSGGERQRVAFVRLLLQKPKIIIMDEATSALDEDSQTSLLTLLQTDLASATVLSVGHRPGLEQFHDRKITLERHDSGAQMSSRKLPKSFWHYVKLALPGSADKGA